MNECTEMLILTIFLIGRSLFDVPEYVHENESGL